MGRKEQSARNNNKVYSIGFKLSIIDVENNIHESYKLQAITKKRKEVE
jgi:hypothetical protein